MVGRHPTEATKDGGYQVDELCKGGKEQVGVLERFLMFFLWLVPYIAFCWGVVYSSLLMSEGAFFLKKKQIGSGFVV